MEKIYDRRSSDETAMAKSNRFKRLRSSLITVVDDDGDIDTTTEITSPAMKKSNRCYRKTNQLISTDILITVHRSPAMEKTNNKRSSPPEYISTTETVDKSKRIKLLLPPSISLDEGISTEILLRLPVISVLRFKSVSKLWLSIVSNHRFRQNHASRHRSATHLFFKNKYGTSHLIKSLWIDRHVNPEITCVRPLVYDYGSLTCSSSCNGLQLLKSSDNHSSKYYLYNPTTHDYKVVVDLPSRITENKYNVCASLAFDPSESLDNNEIVYRIVFLCRDEKYPYGSKFWLEVYSSTTGTCETPLSNTLVGCFGYDDNRGIFCSGAIHWLPSYICNATSMAYFNVHTECINELSIPGSGRVRYFGESQGHLHLVNSEYVYFYKNTVLYVNELKSDYSGWFLKYIVELASIISELPHKAQNNYVRDNEEDGDDCYGTVMSIIRGEEENSDDSTMVLVACGEWVEYNFKKKSTRRLNKFCQPGLYTSLSPLSYPFSTHQFIPSLTCI